MKKFLVFSLALTLPFLSAESCDGKPEKVCKPYAVRHDSYQPDRWWLCNSAGTKETPVQGPLPAPMPVKAKGRG